MIAELNPVLRGWGQYFRTGNAAVKFNQIDTYVVRRLKRLRIKRKGRHLRARRSSSAGRATTSRPSDSTACAAPSSTRRLRNACVTRDHR